MPGTENLQSKLQREIGELSTSINGLIESFRKLKTPLVESHQKVPQATNQLDKISEQTEAAAHRMLDMIEQITQREQEVIDGLGAAKTVAAESKNDKLVGLIADIEEKANTNLNDAYTIMDALQFQDITSQQMNHAAALLEEIENKLRHILGVVGADGVTAQQTTAKKRAYDPHADLFDRKTEQTDIDNIFSKGKAK
jgi:chemotaxis regulatin CheY-phosphate phosphatase CheZ